jgi:hypothetical protein
MRYLRELTMPSAPQGIAPEESIQAIESCENRIERLVTRSVGMIGDVLFYCPRLDVPLVF